MSVISFLLLISGLKKARKLIKYNTHKGLRERLGDDYEVRQASVFTSAIQ